MQVKHEVLALHARSMLALHARSMLVLHWSGLVGCHSTCYLQLSIAHTIYSYHHTILLSNQMHEHRAGLKA